jgi:LPXTG-motif cell wall-anchored protein
VSNVDLTFDDTAGSQVSGSSMASGTFRPTDLDTTGPDAAFPSPAPATTSATSLSTFNRASANGTWSLWVVDDAGGDAGSISGGWCLTITSQNPTATALTSSKNPSVVGESVTFTSTVSSAGNPVSQGTVQFTDGGTAIGDPVPVGNDGKASIPTTTLSVGTHTIAADYTGVGNLADSSGTTSQVVNKATTSTVLTSAPNPSAVDESVTFTATVTSGGDPITSGSVLFTDDGTNLAPAVPVAADGTATLTTSALTAGTHSIVATYDGTATLAGSHSSDLDQVVNKFDTATSLTSSKTPSEFGDLVTFTASVTSNGAPVTTGSVEFTEGATSLGTAPVATDGTASLNTASLAIGSHQIRASFSGTAALGTSSDVVTQVVEKIATTVVLTADPTSTTFGEPVTFAATVTTAAGAVTEGTVTFQFFGIPAVERPLDASGTATYSTATLPAGTEIVTATYSGTDLYATGFANQSFTVDQLETTTTLTSDPERESTAGEDVTFTATVASAGSPVADGSVLFSIDGENPRTVDLQADGTAAFTTSDLAVGTHTIRAQYRGTNTYRLSFDEITYAVNPLAEAGGPYEVAEGGALTLDGSGSTTADRYEWDLNGDDDFTDATGADPTLTWAQLDALGIDDGPADRTVRVRVTAGGGLTSTAAAALRVTNTAPISVITGGLAATVGVPFTIKVGADDPSSADMAADFTYTIDWGDGSPVETLTGPADPPATHTYATVGDFAASFTATDKDGGKGDPTSVTVAVTPAQESPTPTPTPTSTATATATATSTVRSEPTSMPGGGAGDSLASTGSDVGIGTIVLGGVLLLGGGALLLAARRRRASRGTHE